MKSKIFLLILTLILGCAAPPVEKVEKEIISTKNAPAAIGPYSQAVRVGNSIYLAGQIAINPVTGKMLPEGIEAQTHQVLKNIRAVLNAGGFTLNDVVQSQVFLSDLNNYRAMNDVYATYFNDKPPARSAIQAARIPRDALVEIMVTAVK